MRLAAIVILTAGMLCCARAEASRQPVEVEMSNVNLHMTADITLHVRHLRGRFEPVAQRAVAYLDDKTSYTVAVDTGVISIDLASLNALMSQTLADDRSNIDKLTISVDEKGDLRQKGVIDKAVNIPFNVKASIEATPEGRLRVHTKSVNGFGIPMKHLMKLFHVEMDDLLRVRSGHGVTVDGNDLVLDPATLMPPPSIRGRVTSAAIENSTVVQVFGDGAPRHLSPPAISRNFIYWRGGSLAFGKLTMTSTDLELVDIDPKDPFDFSVERWNDQLVAGYSKTTAARGLKAHMPDYNDLPRPKSKAR
ncbi:MAG: hypothetical protein ACRD1W_09260 [Vicinamibacterales bacterium]